MTELMHKIENKNYSAPIPTADELPPEHTDILWWCDDGKGWRVGRFWFTWFLSSHGPTWWMYPPPAPEEKE